MTGAMDEKALQRIETSRRELEKSIARLRKSLRHWQTLELDYEGLREEFMRLEDGASEQICLETARDFKPEALDDKDLLSLMKDASKHPTRRPQYLESTLARRVDYVVTNVRSIRKQLEGEQKKLNAILLAQDPDTQDQAGLPVQEITEELDESGKVVSGKAEAPGSKAVDLVEVLEKASVGGLKEKDGRLTADDVDKSLSELVLGGPSNTVDESRQDVSMLEPEKTGNTDSFKAAELVEARTAEDNASDTGSTESVPLNATDSEEDARLRREMINYNLDTFNAVVAELDLEEGASDVSYDEDSDELNLIPDDEELDDGDLEDDDDIGSEDDQGAAKHLQLDSKYRKQIAQLQEKLGLQDMKNLGPEPNLPPDIKKEVDRLQTPRPLAAEAARKAAIGRAVQADKEVESRPSKDSEGVTSAKPKKAKKKVAFSSELDIAPENATSKDLPNRPKSSDEPHPVNDTVFERSPIPNTTPSAPSNPPTTKPKISRFKQQLHPPTPPPPVIPTPPTNSLVATTVLERSTPSSPSAPDITDIDDEMHRKQIALEHHRLKSKRMHERGGYVKTGGVEGGDGDGEDDGDWYTKDSETGEVRKVSLFKAARLR